jgi:hypothetical protein
MPYRKGRSSSYNVHRANKGISDAIQRHEKKRKHGKNPITRTKPSLEEKQSTSEKMAAQYENIEIINQPSRDKFDSPHFIIKYKLEHQPDYQHKTYFDQREAQILEDILNEWLNDKNSKGFVQNIPTWNGNKGTVTIVTRVNDGFPEPRSLEIHDDWYQDRLYFNDKAAGVLREKVENWLAENIHGDKLSAKQIMVLELQDSANEWVRMDKRSSSHLGHPQLRKFLDVPTDELKREIEVDSKKLELWQESWNKTWRRALRGRGRERGGGIPCNYALASKEDELSRKREALKLREKWENRLATTRKNRVPQ